MHSPASSTFFKSNEHLILQYIKATAGLSYQQKSGFKTCFDLVLYMLLKSYTELDNDVERHTTITGSSLCQEETERLASRSSGLAAVASVVFF